MRIEKRKRTPGQGRSPVNNSNKIYLNLDIITLNMMCSLVISESRNIRRGHLINLRSLVEIIDLESMGKDPEKLKRIVFIKRALEARISLNITNIDMVLKHINGSLIDETQVFDINSLSILSNNDLAWLNGMISETLKHSYIYDDADKFIDICTRLKTSEYGIKGEIVNEFEALINETQAKFRRAKVESASEMTFSLKNGAFEEVVRDFHDQLSSPSKILRCGMQGMNEMLGGGFESTRVYMYFGLPGEGKSTLLLNLAYQIKKCNRDFKPKDPTKIPCIVLLTMENSTRESFERLFNIACTNADNIINYTPDQVINLMRTEGELYLTDDSPIDIIIKYVPDGAVDTSYLYTMTEDLEDEGYEVICMIQDYVKRIRSIDHSPDIRIELGAVVNEFKTFATIKDIPVISASQLNRDASKHIDEGRKNNKTDLLRMLGRSNIGESMLMLENIDGGFLIAPEYDIHGTKFMGIQRIKLRYRSNDRDHIYQPFVVGNGIKLLEDIDVAQPQFKETMRNTDDAPRMNNLGGYGTKLNPVFDEDTGMVGRGDESADNIFENSIMMYSSSTTPANTYQATNNFPQAAYHKSRKLIVPGFFIDKEKK